MPEFIWKWRREIVFTLLIIVSLGMLVSHHEPGLLTRATRQGISFVITPFQKIVTGLVQQSHHLSGLFTSVNTLKKENIELKQKVEQLALRNVLLRNSQAENNELRMILDYKQRHQYEFIPGEIIGRDSASWLRRGILDRGTVDGVKVGAGVISPQGIVGRIVEVNYYSSTIMLLPDEQSSVAGIDERSMISGTIKGKSDHLLSMMYVSSEDDVKVGDVIVTSSLSTLFPKGLPIGEVTQVKVSENGLMLDIDVTPYVDFKTINRFLILKAGEGS